MKLIKLWITYANITYLQTFYSQNLKNFAKLKNFCKLGKTSEAAELWINLLKYREKSIESRNLEKPQIVKYVEQLL